MASRKHTTPAQLTLSLIYHEEWRPVVGYEGLYEVSNLGRVRSLDHKVPYARWNADGLRWQKGRILRPGGKPYFHIKLCKESTVTHIDIHVLVITAFLGKREQGMVVNHIDGNKTNNDLTNLEWVTPRENNLHAAAMGAIRTGERHLSARYTTEQVREMRALFARGVSIRALMQQFDGAESTIQRIVYRRTWKYLED